MSHPKRDSPTRARRGGIPSASSELLDDLDQVVRSLSLDPADAEVLHSRVVAMGAPDCIMGDRIGFDRRSIAEAATLPLFRTAAEDLPDEMERPSSFVETFQLPSGRVVQVQRRYPSEDELHAFLLHKQSYPRPAVWIRELLVGSPPPDTAASVWLLTLDAASVVAGA